MNSSSLDTLVQLPHKDLTKSVRSAEKTVKELKKKAVRLHNTYKLIWPLIDLNSTMEKQYWQSYYCCRELIQEGVYLHAHYCNKRWCFECNAIRCAKMINGYMPVFQKFNNVQFVTLTRPNVTADELKNEIDDLLHTFNLLIRYLIERKKVNAKGIRKLEVTYNWSERTYHPHFHLIVDSPGTAHAILDEWLYRNPEASPAAQNIRKADKGSFTEMFKYATKIVADSKMSLYAMDYIFEVLSRRRIYQPFGIKKVVSEDVENVIAQAYGTLDPETYKVWYFNNDAEDWNSLKGESLLDTIINTILKFDSS